MNTKDAQLKDDAFIVATALLETAKRKEFKHDYEPNVFNTYVSVFLAGMTIENIKQQNQLENPIKQFAKALASLESDEIKTSVNYLLANLADEAPQYAANRLTILRGNVREEIANMITSEPTFNPENNSLVQNVCRGIVDSFVLKNEVDKRVNPRFKGIK